MVEAAMEVVMGVVMVVVMEVATEVVADMVVVPATVEDHPTDTLATILHQPLNRATKGTLNHNNRVETTLQN